MSYYITASGRRVDAEHLSLQDIRIKDIAHALTKICRYGGALPLNIHYSVAQHSIQMYKYAKLSGVHLYTLRAILLHDASEAYLGDIVSGLKNLLPDYQKIESRVQNLIMNKYSPNEYNSSLVKELDTRILLDEAKSFFPHVYQDFKEQLPSIEPLGVKICP